MGFWLRQTFIFALAQTLTMSFLVQRLSKRWIAGETIESAVLASRQANNRGMKALLKYTGRPPKDKNLARHALMTCLDILESIYLEKLQAGLTLKPTQLGLGIGKGYCLANMIGIASRAQELGIQVWIDTESPASAQDTLEIYLETLKHSKDAGITLHADLSRTRKDLLKVLENNGTARLVKGSKGDLTDPDDIEHNFSMLMRLLFNKGSGFALETSNQLLLEEACLLAERYSKDFEFHFPRGMKKKLKKSLVNQDYNVTECMPFGSQLLPHVWEHLKTHKLNTLSALR